MRFMNESDNSHARLRPRHNDMFFCWGIPDKIYIYLKNSNYFSNSKNKYFFQIPKIKFCIFFQGRRRQFFPIDIKFNAELLWSFFIKFCSFVCLKKWSKIFELFRGGGAHRALFLT